MLTSPKPDSSFNNCNLLLYAAASRDTLVKLTIVTISCASALALGSLSK